MQGPYDFSYSRDKLNMMIRDNISTRYKDRDRSYLDLVESIETFISSHRGNYFIFFPSYSYMTSIYEFFLDRNPNLNTVIQESKMTELEREEFLKRFDEEHNLIAFVVMGGIFSEGIDLVGEKLNNFWQGV
ncbi:MAG TPA: helicase C-terminal domain-containing protein [Tissierellaceae bacterium]|nr:helicase C-terminal domain-containing protein [Tissierellaceae bacterium]